ncbi:MAG: hypothetical protein ACYTGX_17910 [Planctomycetota bacterium]|jgi:hypothetical protein
MADWTQITAAQTDADSPIDEDLMDALRENLDAVQQAILLSNFDIFAGDGSGGARTDIGSGTFAVGASKQLTNWTVNSGVTMTLTTSNAYNVCYIGVNGTFTLNGTLTGAGGGSGGASGGSGGPPPGVGGLSWPYSVGGANSWMCGAGAGGGGAGNSNNTGANGGNAQTTYALGASGGAGGYNAAGGAGGGGQTWRGSSDGVAKLCAFMLTTGGGGGGGGAAYDYGGTGYPAGGAGGNGGLSLVIECDTFVFASGASITMAGNNGAAGAAGTYSGAGGGGGGVGGHVIILCRYLTTNLGTVTVSGGSGGAGGGGASGAGGAGGAAGAGASVIKELD